MEGCLPKRGDSGYANANLHNYKSVFTLEQLSASLRATYLSTPVLRAATIMDVDQLHKDIHKAISEDQYASNIIKSLTSDINSSYHTHWSYSDNLL
jgi:hypothetical protein